MKTRSLRLCIIILSLCAVLSALPCQAEEAKPTPEEKTGIFKKNTGNDAPVKKPTEDADAEIKAAKNIAELFSLANGYAAGKEIKKAIKAYQTLIEKFPENPLKFEASFRLAFLRYREGYLKEADEILLGLLSGIPAENTPLKANTAALLKESSGILERLTDASEQKPAVAIGAIVPLKGGYSSYGEAMLRGILLAANTFNQNLDKPSNEVRVYIKDDGTDQKETESAVKSLASMKEVSGIVGPLLSVNAYTAAKAAQQNAVPIITLSQKEGVTTAGDYVFRNSLTLQAQASEIAEYACAKLGKKRFAILRPQNAYGAALSEYFSNDIKKLGGTIVSEVSYEEGTTDFSAELQKIFAVSVKKRREGRRTIKEYTISAKIDALYMPEHHETIGIILPFIKYFGIKDVLLLGSNGWNSESLASSSGDVIEGAVFVDGFFGKSARPGAKEFTEQFRKAYGKEPGIIEAQAYDAAKALISLITPQPAVSAEKTTGTVADNDGKATNRAEFTKPDRAKIKDMLRQAKDITGASGKMRWGSDGEAVKKLFILTIKDGVITEVDGSGAAF